VNFSEINLEKLLWISKLFPLVKRLAERQVRDTEFSLTNEVSSVLTLVKNTNLKNISGWILRGQNEFFIPDRTKAVWNDFRLGFIAIRAFLGKNTTTAATNQSCRNKRINLTINQ